MENKEQLENINNLKEKEKSELNLSCNLRIDQAGKKVIKHEKVKFNTIISDPDDEHPDSHLWE
jgi:hypothetical protein